MSGIRVPKAPVAEYQRIEADLRKRIGLGQWAVGAMLPSRRDLARQYRVSPATMERAITPLIADGTLRSDDRRGTFVAKPRGAVSHATGELVQTSPSDGYVTGRENAAKAMTIGVVGRMDIDDIAKYDQNGNWVRAIVQSLERTFSSDGKLTIFFNRIPEDGSPMVSLADAIVSAVDEGVDALVLVSLDLVPAEVDEALGVLGSHHVPVVCVLAGELTRPVPHVFYDNTSAGYQAAHHLLLRGHRQISIVAPFNATWVTERLAGIRNAIDHAGFDEHALDVQLAKETAWVYNDDPDDLGYEYVQKALERGWQPAGALICMNDGIAFGAIRALTDIGKRLGADYAMVGFDDNPRSRTLRLTSMHPPVEAMGEEAARLLLMELHGEPVSTQVRLRAHLIPRESTSRVAASRENAVSLT